MIFHFRETHNVTEDTPLGDSLDEIEMKTFTNGKGGKLFIFMSIKDTDPFGCMVDFPTSSKCDGGILCERVMIWVPLDLSH